MALLTLGLVTNMLLILVILLVNRMLKERVNSQKSLLALTDHYEKLLAEARKIAEIECQANKMRQRLLPRSWDMEISQDEDYSDGDYTPVLEMPKHFLC